MKFHPPVRRVAAVLCAFSMLLGAVFLASGCDILFLAAPTTAPTAEPTPWFFNEEALFQTLLSGIEGADAKIDLSSLEIPDSYQDKVYEIFTKVVGTEPSAYRCRGALEYDLSSLDDGKTWTIEDVRPGYQPETVLETADTWIAEMGLAAKTPFERIQLLHDRIVLETVYDEAAASKTGANDPAFTAVGLFDNGKAVCQGYAEALTVLLNRAGVPTVYASGTSKGVAHAWVIVQLDGNWYHVDATYDDPVPDTVRQTNYRYFLMNDEQLAKDHVRDFAEPVCTDGSYEWMHRMDHVVRLKDGSYAYSDVLDDGAVVRVDASGSNPKKVPFQLYGETHDTTRGYYLCVSDDDLCLSNYSDGAAIYVQASGENILRLFKPASSPDGIFPAKNLWVEGGVLHYDLMDDDGNVTASRIVTLP
jgi:transglutaminase-like putative cysteine protease